MVSSTLNHPCANLTHEQSKELGVLDANVIDQFLLRQAVYYKDGLLHFNQIMESEGFNYELLRQNMLLKETDNRFFYIHDIPAAAFLAASRGMALEKSIFNKSSSVVAELAMLFSIFTNLLDGILDETPEILSKKDLDFLQKVMIEQPWAEEEIVSPPLFSDTRHPVVAMLFNVMCAIVRRVVTSEIWDNDKILRQQFCAAAKAAFLSEWKSTKYSSLFIIPDDIKCAERDLHNKSCNWAWVISMAPFCIHGWPINFNVDLFYEFTQKLGVFGGWLDDVSDVSHDLQTSKWSNVFLEIFKLVGNFQFVGNNFPLILQNSLTDESVIKHLSRRGLKLYVELIDCISRFPGRSETLILSIQDNILVFLDPWSNIDRPIVNGNDD